MLCLTLSHHCFIIMIVEIITITMAAREISALKVRNNLGQILDETHYLGREFVIERAGKPMAVIVPVKQYWRIRRKPRKTFEVLDQIHARLASYDTKQAECDALEATMAVRHGKRR